MPLTPVPPASDWSAVIAEAAKMMFNGELRAFIPGELDSGADDVVLIDWRPARAQHLAMPLEMSDGSGWNTKRRFRFQTELRADDPIIPKGAIVRFRGGKDHTLTRFAFQVTSAVNSSHAALRTIETITEGGAE